MLWETLFYLGWLYPAWCSCSGRHCSTWDDCIQLGVHALGDIVLLGMTVSSLVFMLWETLFYLGWLYPAWCSCSGRHCSTWDDCIQLGVHALGDIVLLGMTVSSLVFMLWETLFYLGWLYPAWCSCSGRHCSTWDDCIQLGVHALGDIVLLGMTVSSLVFMLWETLFYLG